MIKTILNICGSVIKPTLNNTTSGNILSRGKNYQFSTLGFISGCPFGSSLTSSLNTRLGALPSSTLNVRHYFEKDYKKEVKVYYDKDGNEDLPVSQVHLRSKRLRWGIYIHPIPGRKKHLYRKPLWLKDRLKQHIFTSENNSFLFDNMLNSKLRKHKFYPEDPYEPYHKRTGVPWDANNRKRKFYP